MIRRLFLLASLLLLSLSAAPLLAQKAALTVTPVWRPGSQLTSTTGDMRYVDLELNLTGNVQFWAMNIACTFPPALLEGYAFDSTGNSTPNDPGDDVSMITYGSTWGLSGTDFLAVNGGGTFNAANGTLTMTATRLGDVLPMGTNGATYHLTLATIRLRVKDLGTNLRTQSANVNCRTMEFVDRDGRIVVRATQARTPALSLRTGYQISGTALLQGKAASANAGISVGCMSLDGSTVHTTTTNARGQFVLGNNTLIRDYGRYICVFLGPIDYPLSEYLTAYIAINLTGHQHQLLPVILKAGNVIKGNAATDNAITTDDLIYMTSGWQEGSVSEAYSYQDINGDKKIDRTDLAIFAGNYGMGTQDGTAMDSSHMLYGLSTTYSGTFPNSRIYWGDSNGGSLTQLVNPGNDRDFWPAISPDGQTVAFTRINSRTGVSALLTAPTTTGRGTAKITDRTFTHQAFAPSWSPDGQRIAFICSDSVTGVSGHEFNQGSICVTDVGSNTARVVTNGSRIYPPTWYDNNILIFGATGNHTNADCRNSLCYVNLTNNSQGAFSGDVLNIADADMPTLVWYDHDATPNTPDIAYLFFRSKQGNTREIRVSSQVMFNGTQFTIASTTLLPGNHQVDYMTVSPSLNIAYYESFIIDNALVTSQQLHILRYDNMWASNTRYIDGFVGNPTITAGLTPGLPWSGSESEPTLHHTQRATIHWIQ